MRKFSIAVVGGRDFNDYPRLCEKILHYVNEVCPNEPYRIVSGGAKGADSLGERFADEHGVEKKIFPAEWDKYGKSAGYKRNKTIVAHSDFVIAFWDGKSRGTENTIHLAKVDKVPGVIVQY